VGRDTAVYAEESADVSDAVRAWALERGSRETYRIVLAGYEGEHDELESAGWRVVSWKAHGGYSHLSGNQDNPNRHRERLWFSPHCISRQEALF
jgi:DNA adenine methylase